MLAYAIRAVHVAAGASALRRLAEPGVCRICPHYEGFPRGLGDVVETAARLTGLKAIADFRAARKAPKASARPKGAAGQCGGCAARRQALNEAVPFSKDG